jgi:hypothetical protein
MAEPNTESASSSPQSFGKLSVSGAALKLGLTYNQTRDLLLTGRIRGGQEDDNRTLWVDGESVEEYMKAQGAA